MMKAVASKTSLKGIRAILSKYRTLIYWLTWGIAMTLVFGMIQRDYRTPFMIFMGFGVFLGVTLQFVVGRWLRRATWTICVLVALMIVWKPSVSAIQRVLNLNISRNFLVADARQMASILEATHPDPYMQSGGKIAFHRKLQDLIRTIPREGMTQTEFYRHLSPLLAAVGDGHTSLWPPFTLDPQSPGGIPLYFQAVEDVLYVAAVTDPDYKDLIGFRLLAVESIPMGVLLDRQAQIKGYDNRYQLMRYLGYDGSLWYGKLLEHLIPEWQGGVIHVDLLSPEEIEISVAFEPNLNGQETLVQPATIVDLPSTESSDYVYRFMDEDRKTVLLLVENMYAYRETFEMELQTQKSLRKGLAKHLYQRYNHAPAPKSTGELIEGIPSATELFRDLVSVMKDNQTENLIIDLRRKQGGNAFISSVLFYFLYGKEALVDFSTKKSIFIKKYSPLFWKQYRGWNIRDINEHQPIELLDDDYDFSGYPEPGESLDRQTAIRIIEDEASKAATFWKEYQSGEYAGYYRPENIFLLCSPLTNSSGYAFMYDHWAAGGKLVGVPSSQAGNGFGAWVGFRLNYSRLGGGISHLFITHFRDNPELGRLFRPDFELSFGDLRSVEFDPNAEVLHALKLSGVPDR
jgi:hypothetical protein